MNIFQILDTIRTDLHNRYDHELSGQEIDQIFNRIVAEHKRDAAVCEYLPVMVEREATAEIENIVLHGPLRTVAKREVVQFVNRDNGSMAELAAALLRSRAGEQARVVTAWTHPENATDAKLDTVAAERDLDLTGERHKSQRVLETPDITVYLGTNEHRDLGGRRELVWDVPASTDGMKESEVHALIADLEKRIVGLVELMELAPASPALTS